jgi:hypothetical protein
MDNRLMTRLTGCVVAGCDRTHYDMAFCLKHYLEFDCRSQSRRGAMRHHLDWLAEDQMAWLRARGLALPTAANQ